MQFTAHRALLCLPHGLLKRKSAPAREEVKVVQKPQNVCRCTEYKQLVDAVMLAAEEIDAVKDHRKFGISQMTRLKNTTKPFVRPSALGKACGTVDYGDDVELKSSDTLHVTLVQPRKVIMEPS